MTKFIGIIPARYASTRFPGKPLAMLGGQTVIERVYRRAKQSLDRVVVATDDVRIAEAVRDFGGEAVMTSTEHRSGTDRCREAYDNLDEPADVVINIQGDEPFIAIEQIELLKGCFKNPETSIATLARKYNPSGGFEGLFDPNVVKVVFDDNKDALYFSRSIIPYVRGVEWKQWLEHTTFHTHVGIYAYRVPALRSIAKMPQSALEKAESLEQLRWLANGLKIAVAVTESPTIGIDTPADLEAAERYLASLNNNA